MHGKAEFSWAAFEPLSGYLGQRGFGGGGQKNGVGNDTHFALMGGCIYVRMNGMGNVVLS